MLDGTPTFRLDDEIVIAGPGVFVNVPKGVLHNFRDFSDDPMRMILTFTPAGIEKFFEETLERAYDLTQDCPANLARSARATRRRAPATGWSSSPTPERDPPPGAPHGAPGTCLTSNSPRA